MACLRRHRHHRHHRRHLVLTLVLYGTCAWAGPVRAMPMADPADTPQRAAAGTSFEQAAAAPPVPAPAKDLPHVGEPASGLSLALGLGWLLLARRRR